MIPSHPVSKRKAVGLRLRKQNQRELVCMRENLRECLRKVRTQEVPETIIR